jgi:hypothetical protein
MGSVQAKQCWKDSTHSCLEWFCVRRSLLFWAFQLQMVDLNLPPRPHAQLWAGWNRLAFILHTS